MTTPNPLQQAAIDGLIQFAEKKEHLFALLEGPAGSGKTYSVAQVIMQVQAAGREVVISTPTHKSKRVVLNALAKYGIKVTATTVSALIGKAPSTTDEPDEDGKAQWMRAEGSGLKPESLLIVDEISMVGKTDAKSIEKVVKNSQSQAIFSGDFSQLRPVKDASIYESMERIPVRFKLSEVMRSGSNAIVGMSKAVRTTGRLDLDLVDNEHVFLYNDAKRFEEAFVNTEGAVAIAYTNKRTAELNRMKRRKIYGENPAKFMPGETLILTEAPFFLDKRIGGKYERVKIADNNDQLVAQYALGETIDGNPFTDDFVTSTRLMMQNPETGVSFEARALTYDEYVSSLKPTLDEVIKNVRMFSARLESLSKKRSTTMSLREIEDHFESYEVDWIRANSSRTSKWITSDLFGETFTPAKGSWSAVKGLAWARDCYGWRNQFAVLLYEHAMTAHKSQGSTFKHCFVCYPNLLTIRDPDDRQAACYVAVSRASDSLHIRI